MHILVSWAIEYLDVDVVEDGRCVVYGITVNSIDLESFTEHGSTFRNGGERVRVAARTAVRLGYAVPAACAARTMLVPAVAALAGTAMSAPEKMARRVAPMADANRVLTDDSLHDGM
jgi:hypothetical protein